MRVAPSRTCRLPHEARFLGCAPDRSRFVLAAKDRRYTVLDGLLRAVHGGTLPVEAGAVAIHPSGDLLAIASRTELILADLTGTIVLRRTHRAWKDWEGGDVVFLGDGSRVLAVLPADGAARLVLLQGGSGKVIAEAEVSVPEEAGFFLLRTPLEETWGLWAGAGQDGQWSHWVRIERDRLTIQGIEALTGKEHGPVQVDGPGREFLVEADGGLERRRFPDGKLLARLEPPEGEDFAFSEPCHLASGRALVMNAATSQLHVVALAPMTLGEEVAIEGHEPRHVHEAHGLDLWYLRPLPRAAALCVFGAPGGPQIVELLEGAPLFEAER
jgi:hypothetical protein